MSGVAPTPVPRRSGGARRPTWRALLAESADRLRAAGLATADVEARWMAEEAAGQDGAAFVLRLDEVPGEHDVERVDAMLARRLTGEPLQYVLGRWGFRTLDLLVDRRVLIPRPETEQVVEEALVAFDLAIGGQSTSRRGRRSNVVDLGCGSGAIGLSIAVERRADVWCVDSSPDAVAVTRLNLGGLGRAATNVTVLEGSWYEPLPSRLAGAVDLIVTNPPYVASSDRLPAEIADWEPTGALVAGPTGLEAIEHVLRHAPTWLAPGGVLVSEIGDKQARTVTRAARHAGFTEVDVRPDLAGRVRTLIALRP